MGADKVIMCDQTGQRSADHGLGDWRPSDGWPPVLISRAEIDAEILHRPDDPPLPEHELGLVLGDREREPARVPEIRRQYPDDRFQVHHAVEQAGRPVRIKDLIKI